MLTEQQKSTLMLTVFVGAVGLLVIAYYHFMLGRASINNYEIKAKDLNAEIATLNGQLAQINEMWNKRELVREQKAEMARVTRRLPSSPDAPGFLNALVSGLATTGILQEKVKPDATTDRSLYTEIPYDIKAFGHYHAFGQFLTLIEQNPDRFMRVKSLKIKNNPERPSIHPIEMEIATFMFNQRGDQGGVANAAR